MADKKISPVEKVIMNAYFPEPVQIPEPSQEEEPGQEFRQMLQQKKQDFSHGKIPYQRILRSEGWVYKIG